jgi:AraC-like DNA-binding protein
MNVILISGAFMAVFMAVLIFTKRQKSVSDWFLLFLFILNALVIALAYAEVLNRSSGYPFPFLIHLSTPFILLHGPLLWFYIRSVTTDQFRFRFVYVLHGLPFLFVFTMLTLSMFSLPAAERIASDATESFRQDWIFPVVIAIIFFNHVLYYAWGLILRSNYRKRLHSFFSQTAGREMLWLKRLIITGIVFHTSISVLYALDYVFQLMAYDMLQLAGFSFASAFVIMLGFFGIRQGNIFTGQTIELSVQQAHTQPQTDVQPDGKDKEFISKLLELMHTSKPWLDAELTIAQLAQKTGVGSDYLSAVINTHLHKNFFEFVNHYRVEEFKKLCRKPESMKLTIIALAYDSGFNSKATFNRVFKNMTGKTPGEYFREQERVIDN